LLFVAGVEVILICGRASKPAVKLSTPANKHSSSAPPVRNGRLIAFALQGALPRAAPDAPYDPYRHTGLPRSENFSPVLGQSDCRVVERAVRMGVRVGKSL
jgi:hypothetical protein